MKIQMPPQDDQVHIAPEGGWQEHTHYVVEIAHNRRNPVHRRILSIGFINNPTHGPLAGGYTCLLGGGENDITDRPYKLWYLKFICKIDAMNDING